MRKGLGLALVVVCATSAPAAQQVQLPRRPRVIGIVRDPNGIPLPGVAVVTVLSPPSAPLVTFTGEDGRFALPKAVSDSAVIDVLHLARSEEHTSELQSLAYLVCRLLLEKKKI